MPLFRESTHTAVSEPPRETSDLLADMSKLSRKALIFDGNLERLTMSVENSLSDPNYRFHGESDTSSEGFTYGF